MKIIYDKSFGVLLLVFLILIPVLFMQKIQKSPVHTPMKIHTITQSNGKQINHVFLIVMENHNWADIKENEAPFITKTLLPMGAHAEQYYNPPGNHPSEPNYIWLEAGKNFGITNDNPPTINHVDSRDHITTLLANAGYTWKVYAEGITGTTCPLQAEGNYAPKHIGPIFFNDITDNNNPHSQTCIQHIRPYTELESDLTKDTVPNYVLITPNLCDDMHNCSIQTGDNWLATEVPKIVNSKAFQKDGALFITWDEGEGGDGPIGMIIISPFAKKNYSNSIHYDHSSYVKTIEEIFSLKPFLGAAATANDLSDFFTISLKRSNNKP